MIMLDNPTVKHISMICSGVKCSARSPKVRSSMTSIRVDRWAYRTIAASSGS